ncbi:MAG: phospholipase/carboxylesterase [Thermoleophilaceae bacterium]|nr:phospholipase/carboxylesterase [Thermoleophilaceae bacterium]
MSGIEDLAHHLRPADGDPEGALVLLHGRGTSEDDIAPLFDEIDPDSRLVGVAPRGPLSLPPGGAHWYVVQRVGFPEPGTFFPTLERLTAWFDALPETIGVPVERTVLGGFSQGAVMAYALALGDGRPRPAGLIALSGFIPTVDGFALDLDDLDGYPVAIGHGTFDPVIEAEFGRAARKRLEDAGAAVTWRESPIPHTVDPGFVAELKPFVRAALNR